MKTTHILSIDFDYFQQTDEETAKSNYPDGHDLNPELSAICWSDHYRNERYPIRDITVNQKEIDALKSLLLNQRDVKECMIALSHVSIYNFITSKAESEKLLHITNIDMHHDMFNNNKTLDCGNWLSHISKQYKLALEWVVNPISESCYGLDERFSNILFHTIKDLKNQQYQYIFLCRSDMWTPPHLDRNFDELKQFFIENLACPIQVQQGFDVDRQQIITEIKNPIDNLLKEDL